MSTDASPGPTPESLEAFEPDGPHDRRLALRAGGALRAFNQAGVLTAADVHLATRLCALAGEEGEQVALAVAFTARSVRHGSVGADLDALAGRTDEDLPWERLQGWEAAVRSSPLVASGVLHCEHGLVYLDRHHDLEVQVARDLHARQQQPAPQVQAGRAEEAALRIFPVEGYAEQRTAAVASLHRWTTVLTGGPGTGKTTAVAGLLALLADQAGRPLRVALAAPTGKAAARLAEAVAQATERLPTVDRDRVGTLEAMTLHRLLQRLPDNPTRFRHHRGNRLPHEVVVVDETSMLSLTLMARLLEAVRPDARLVLVGDPDQLASVEAGAVLADLVRGWAGEAESPVTALVTSHRFGRQIGDLAAAVRRGDAEETLASLRAGDPAVQFVDTEDPWVPLRPVLLEHALQLRAAAVRGDGAAALEALARHRLLCAHRDGPFGVARWNRLVEQAIREATGDPLWEPMYPGRPLLVTANDYGLGLFNGDAGVIVRDPEAGTIAHFAGPTGMSSLPTSRLAEVDTMHAMTVHKAQGSQADQITVLLPPPESPLLTRELLYTAITRAQGTVRVVGTEASVRAAVARRVRRATGLQQRLRPSD